MEAVFGDGVGGVTHGGFRLVTRLLCDWIICSRICLEQTKVSAHLVISKCSISLGGLRVAASALMHSGRRCGGCGLGKPACGFSWIDGVDRLARCDEFCGDVRVGAGGGEFRAKAGQGCG